MRGAAGSGDDHLQPLISSAPGKLCQLVRCPVRRDNFAFSPDPELTEQFYGMTHRSPIGLTPHYDRDRRQIRHSKKRKLSQKKNTRRILLEIKVLLSS